MLIELDGRTYEVPIEYQEKLIDQMWELAMLEYEKVPKSYHIGGMFLARKILYDMEASLTKSHGKEVALKIARPTKGADPNKHLLWLMSSVLREAIKSATFHIDTQESTDTVTAFAISIPRESATRGQVATNGDIGQREDNSGQNARRQIGPAISDQ